MCVGWGGGGGGGGGVIMRKGIEVKDYKHCSDRIIWIRISTKPVETLIIQVYMPTSTYEDEVERVYEKIEVLKGVGEMNNLILIEDWNAVVGEGKKGSNVGKYGLGKRNERGDRLAEFCVKRKLVIANTLQKSQKINIYVENAWRHRKVSDRVHFSEAKI